MFICIVKFNQKVKLKSKMTEKQTEQKILDAARKLFTQKGMGATRMQEIADEAGINKALLHYYFRSKQKLFEQTFQTAFAEMRPRVQVLLTANMSIEERIGAFVDEYFQMIQKNRFLPLFILQEVQRDPQNLFQLMTSAGFNPRQIMPVLATQMQKTVEEVFDMILNTIALVVFPFIAQPLMTHVFFNGDQKSYEKMLEGRKERVTQIILMSLEIQ